MNIVVADVFDEIKAVLEYYQAMGIEKIDMDYIKESTCGKRSDEVNKKERETLLRRLREEIGDCRRCKLFANRKNIVFGTGNPYARLMFIGEAPGREEDQQGIPFVGDAGILLTKMIEKMGMKRDDVYIANVIKCRPPMNRDPDFEEISSCFQFLERQVEIIKPEVIMTLGRIALQALMGNFKIRITLARGKFFYYKDIPVMPTFHPAYLLRNPKDKWLTWSDAQKVIEKLMDKNK